MTTTQAIRIARHEITMHRQGHGWYVSYTYNGNRWTGSDEMPYAVARETVRRLRIERALDLLDRDDATVHQAVESGDRFEAAVREAVRQ